jgi:hypothetical protein
VAQEKRPQRPEDQEKLIEVIQQIAIRYLEHAERQSVRAVREEIDLSDAQNAIAASDAVSKYYDAVKIEIEKHWPK